jgi:hypothetical protein
MGDELARLSTLCDYREQITVDKLVENRSVTANVDGEIVTVTVLDGRNGYNFLLAKIDIPDWQHRNGISA